MSSKHMTRSQWKILRLEQFVQFHQLLPSFFILWYDLPTNSLTNYPTDNRISWISMRKKIGLQLGPTFGWDPLPVRAHYWLGPTFGQGPP